VSIRRRTGAKVGLLLGVVGVLLAAGFLLRWDRTEPPGREPRPQTSPSPDETGPEEPSPTSTPTPACTAIGPDDDLLRLVNGAENESFCLEAGVYDLGEEVLEPARGSTIVGVRGSAIPRGPGVAIRAPVRIVGEGEAVIRPQGPDVVLRWIDVSGAQGDVGCRPQCGRGIDGADAPRLTVSYARLHNNDNNGAGGIEGGSLFDHVEVHDNGTPEFDGCCSGGLKGADQYEVRFSYIHDNHNNGVWCDAGCFEPSAPLNNGFWVHDNLIVNNWHNGVRYENSPKDGDEDEDPEALIEDNLIHGNDLRADGGHRGGVVVNSAQNATVRGNRFGRAVVNGVLYPPNGKAAIEFGGSRTDLEGNSANDNELRGEAIEGCELSGVECGANG
jgi:hypothetical protein